MAVPIWGQVVIGPPGSGKSTYCRGMYELLNSSGRSTIVVNLDPANENLIYPCAVNIFELITLEDVAEAYELGPNGGLMYCLEYLDANFDWLESKLNAFRSQQVYILIDCPGQIELYTTHSSIFSIFQKLTKLQYHFTCVHLVDSISCFDSTKFISSTLNSLSSMVRIELPHVNILSKIDLLKTYGELPFTLDLYTDLFDLSKLIDAWKYPPIDDATLNVDGSIEPSEGLDNADTSRSDFDNPNTSRSEENPVKVFSKYRQRKFLQKYQKLNERFIELIEDFSLVAFVPMSVKKPSTMVKVVRLIDKSNGYVPTKPSADARKEGSHKSHNHFGEDEHGGEDEEDTRNKISSLRENIDSWDAIDEELEDAYVRERL
jgi:GPN-loop GTPase